MIQLSLDDLQKQFPWEVSEKSVIFKGISTDSRKISRGSLFIAIRGEHFNGHDFIDQAIQQGASAVLVDHPINPAIPQIIVKDTLTAFGQISEYWRSRFSLPIVGVTGSNGKTTLKNMIGSILRAACDDQAECVLTTEGNLNNNIGVPIMLSRLNDQHRYAVIEMGMNHFGEIEYLTKLTKPSVAIINNAAEAHLEGLKDVAGVARAKGEIFLGLAPQGAAILNRDDAHFHYWSNLVTAYQTLTFGLQHTADITAALFDDHILLHTPKGQIEVKLPLIGKHNVMNALAATAASLALNISLTAIKKGLENVQAAPGRLHQYHLPNDIRIIDDTYNANPFSTHAAIQTLAAFSGEKILVLGDMKELGSDAKQYHFTTGERARAAGINQLFTLGNMSKAATEAFGTAAQHFTEQKQLITALQPHLKPGATILVKGSRSMHMEKIVAELIPSEQLAHLH